MILFQCFACLTDNMKGVGESSNMSTMNSVKKNGVNKIRCSFLRFQSDEECVAWCITVYCGIRQTRKDFVWIACYMGS